MPEEKTVHKYLIELSTTEKLYTFLEDLTNTEKQLFRLLLRKSLHKILTEIQHQRNLVR